MHLMLGVVLLSQGWITQTLRPGILGDQSLAVDSVGNPLLAFVDSAGELYLASRGGCSWTWEGVAPGLLPRAPALDVGPGNDTAILGITDSALILYRSRDGWAGDTVFPGPVSGYSLAHGPDGTPYVSFIAGGNLLLARPSGGGWDLDTLFPWNDNAPRVRGVSVLWNPAVSGPEVIYTLFSADSSWLVSSVRGALAARADTALGSPAGFMTPGGAGASLVHGDTVMVFAGDSLVPLLTGAGPDGFYGPWGRFHTSLVSEGELWLVAWDGDSASKERLFNYIGSPTSAMASWGTTMILAFVDGAGVIGTLYSCGCVGDTASSPPGAVLSSSVFPRERGFVLSLPESGPQEVSVYAADGRLVLRKTLDPGPHRLGGGLKTGVYAVVVNGDLVARVVAVE